MIEKLNVPANDDKRSQFETATTCIQNTGIEVWYRAAASACINRGVPFDVFASAVFSSAVSLLINNVIDRTEDALASRNLENIKTMIAGMRQNLDVLEQALVDDIEGGDPDKTVN